MDGRTTNHIWSGYALRGMIALVFGIAATFWPGITLVTLVYLFGGFVLASGVVSLVLGLTNVYDKDLSFLSRVLAIVLGIVEVGIGVYLLRHPFISFATMILIIGFALIIRGVIDVFTGLFESGGAMYRLVMVVAGLVAGIAGVLLLFQPASAGVAFVWILGIYALITGPLLIALAIDIKNSEERVDRVIPVKKESRR